MNTVLEVANVEKYYGNKSNLTKALDGISFSVEEGEFVGIMGASGSGKTTLLNCVSTIDRVTSGKIIVNDIDVTRLRGNHLNQFRREELGFIFQDFNLLDTLTAYENISLALTIQRISPAKIHKSVKEIADKLGIEDILEKYPYQMSGGQKQRLAVATAILSDKDVLVFDEPTSGLDYHRMLEVSNMIRKLNDENKVIIIVSHDFEFLGRTCDKIFDMEGCSKERR